MSRLCVPTFSGKEFTECRGVILQTKEGQEVHVPARFVVCGVGSLPNSGLVKDTLNLSPKGFVITDDHLRTGYANGGLHREPNLDDTLTLHTQAHDQSPCPA